MNNLQEIISLSSISALTELTASQIAALDKMNIHRLSDLLHFKPLRNAKLLMNLSSGALAFDLKRTNLLSKEFENKNISEIRDSPVTALLGMDNSLAQLFKDHFKINTIGQLATFKPFYEAERIVAKHVNEFVEPASAPDELMPKIVGSVSSRASYSNFIKEKRLRFKGLELFFDGQKFFVDQRLATLFAVKDFTTTNFVETPEVQVGYISKLSQQWVNYGTHLGEVIHSLPLAPGESRNIALIDWKRKQTATRKEDTKANEQLTNDLFHKRALDEVTRSTAAEHQGGGTDIAAGTIATAGAGVLGAALVGGIAGTLPGAAIGGIVGAIAGVPIADGGGATIAGGALAGAVIGFGIGAAISVGASLIGAANAQLGTIQSDSNGDRSIDAAISQNIDESIQQKSSSIRSLWSSVIVTDEQAENESLTTRNITNYNHSHALTIQYFEVLQHYRTELCMTQAEPFLLLPFAPLSFTFDLIVDFWDILKRGVRDINLLNEIDNLINDITEVKGVEDSSILKNITVLLTRGNTRNGTIFTSTDFPDAQVNLIGIGIAQSKQIIQNRANFTFVDNVSASALTGIQFEGLNSSENVIVSIWARIMDDQGEIQSKNTNNIQLRADTGGIISYTIAIGEGNKNDPEVKINRIKEVVRYFNAHRYFFTRLLLLAIEKEQLIDLVEALILRVPNISERRVVGAVAGAALDKSPKSGNTSTSAKTNTFSTAFANLIADSVITLLLASVERNSTDATIRGTFTNDIGKLEKSIKEFIGFRITELPKNKEEQLKIETSIIKFVDIFFSENKLLSKDRTQVIDELKNDIAKAFKSFANKDSSEENFIHLSEFIDTTPFAITGNTLMFKMKKITDNEVLQNSLLLNNKKLQELRDYPAEIGNHLKNILQNKAAHTVSSDIFLPTSGVFAEAILGRSNASEKIDITRYINWQDMPIPNLAPAINALTAGQHNSNPLATTPTVPSGVLNILNTPQLPDPTGMAAILGAIQNGNIFRDMSKSDQLVTVMSNLSNLAQSMAQQAGSLAGQAQSDALKSATEIGKQVAQLASQAANQPSNSPSSFTEKGGAANSLEKFFSNTSNAGNEAIPDALRNILGVGGSNSSSQSLPQTLQPFFTDKKNISDLIGDFSNSGLGEMKLNTDGGNIELKSGAEKSNIQNAGFIDLGNDELPDNLIFWQDVFNHTVPQNIENELSGRNIKVQDLNSAQDTAGILRAALNLDFYQVRISEMPDKIPGTKFTEEEFLKEIRIRFSNLHSTNHIDDNPFTKDESLLNFDTDFPFQAGGNEGPKNLIPILLRANTTFTPFEDSIDKPKWESINPLGAVMQFTNPGDNMAVVASKAEKDFWIFSTVGQFAQGFDFESSRITGNIGTHPVSGNRMFALKKQSNGEFIFFTKGADRTSGLAETIFSPLIFAGGHGIWLSLQAGIANFVKTNNGKAEIIKPVSQRVEYKKVLEFFQNKNGTDI